MEESNRIKSQPVRQTNLEMKGVAQVPIVKIRHNRRAWPRPTFGLFGESWDQ